MKKKHALAISVLLGVAVVAGLLAVIRTTGAAGSTAAVSTASDATIRAREAKLDAWAESLRSALAEKTPKLPPIPKVPDADRGSSSGLSRVVYVEAPTTSGGASYEGDDPSEHEGDHVVAEHEEDD